MVNFNFVMLLLNLIKNRSYSFKTQFRITIGEHLIVKKSLLKKSYSDSSVSSTSSGI